METRMVYYEEPYRRELTATVTEIRSDGVVLDQTICYPEGGGQGGDRGSIGGCELLDTVRQNSQIIHHVKEPTFAAGERVMITLDWQRRHHFMQMHTAQHMASGILHEEFGIGTVSVHLGERIMTIECDVPSIERDTIEALVRLVNAKIRANLAVSAKEYRREKALALGLRRPVKVDGDVVRLVSVEGVDTIACGGLHVARTEEIELCIYVGQERIRGHVRLIFAVAEAAFSEIRLHAQVTEALGTLFSAPVDELVSVATRAMESAHEAQSEAAVLKARLAATLLTALIEQSGRTEGIPLVLWEVEEPIGLKEIGRAACEANDLLLCATVEEEGRFLWMVAAVGAGDGRFDFKEACTSLLADFAARGGGRGPLYQGTAKGDAAAFRTRFAELVG